MKKLILSVFCLGLTLTAGNLLAENQTHIVISKSIQDGRHVIKSEELPEPIIKVLSSDAYKGWTVQEAAMVTGIEPASNYYEVTLVMDKETKMVKFQKDGTVIK